MFYLLLCASLPSVSISVEVIPTSIKLFRREREYKVVIKFVARANLHHLGQFLAGKRADAPKEALQILDIVLRELSTRRYEILRVAVDPFYFHSITCTQIEVLFLPNACI